MIKKNALLKWSDKEEVSFNCIKHGILQALASMSSNFSEEFILYTFSTHNLL